jgi:hypothetical protein
MLVIGQLGWLAPALFEVEYEISLPRHKRPRIGRVNNACFDQSSGALELLRVQGFKLGTRAR